MNHTENVMNERALLILAALILSVEPSAAQFADSTGLSHRTRFKMDFEHRSRGEGAGAGATLGMLVGGIGGGALGYSLRKCTPGEWFCGWDEAEQGAFIGSALAIPIGACATRCDRGAFVAALGTSLAIEWIGSRFAGDLDKGAAYLGTVTLQIAASTIIATRSSRRREAVQRLRNLRNR
jgi:hypothetical protein